MKFRTTKKEMKENYDRIICSHNLQHLLRYRSPIAYSTRAEGWACDYYDIDGVLISSGYAPIPARNTHSSYEIDHRYDELARAINENYDIDYEARKKLTEELLSKYIEEVAK